MAQTNYTPIILYNSGTTTNAPSASNLASGELAINYTDGKLFYKDNSSAVQVIGWKTTPTTAGGTGLTSYTAGDLPYYASGSALSKLGIGTSGYVLQSNGSAPTWVAQSTLSVGTATNATNTAITNNTSSSATWYPTIVSATTGNLPQTTSSTQLSFVPSTGKLTATSYEGAWAGSTIGTTYGGTGLTSLTAGYIPYGNGTSAFSSSSNLNFDGSNLSVGGNVTVTTNLKTVGQVFLGGTSAVLGGYTNIAFNANSYNGLVINETTGTFTGASFMYFAGAGTACGNISRVALTNAVAYNTTSDKRLKNDNGISTDISVIDNTVIHDFSWKTDGTIDKGVFAQEAQKVKPIAVYEGTDEIDSNGFFIKPWGVDYSKYVPDLIVYCQQLKKVMQEQQEIIKSLITRIETLETK